jgi:citrate lyase beta subunit
MPGDDLRKIRKATTLKVDSICMDMEDGVALNHKADARQTIASALRELDFANSERLARINPIGSGLEHDDLQVILPAHPDGIVIPKVEYPEQIAWVSAQIADAEVKFGWEGGSIILIVIIESARAILNLAEIGAADQRMHALIFGSDDLAVDLGATRTREAWEVFFARSAVVTCAAAYDLQAIDMVCIDVHDLNYLRQEAQRGYQLGFSGKQVIHPVQVDPVQEIFTPTDTMIAEAKRVIEAFEFHQTQGAGAFVLDGKMVDAPLVKSAQRILDRARAVGLTF